MIAPQHRTPESRIQPDQWHPDPQDYRPPDASSGDFMKSFQEKLRGIASKHPVLVVVAAASIGTLLGCLVKRR